MIMRDRNHSIARSAGYVHREKDAEDTIQLLRRYSDEELTLILEFVTQCTAITQAHMSKQS